MRAHETNRFLIGYPCSRAELLTPASLPGVPLRCASPQVYAAVRSADSDKSVAAIPGGTAGDCPAVAAGIINRGFQETAVLVLGDQSDR